MSDASAPLEDPTEKEENNTTVSTDLDRRIVVFDYGEVISPEPSRQDRAEILGLSGTDAETFWAAYWRHRPRLDLGTLTVTQYWRAIEADTRARWSTQRLHQLYLADFRSWLAIDQRVLQILLELKSSGTHLALLSNAGPDFSSYYRSGMLGDLFDDVFTSAELGALKPDPAIFHTVLSQLGVHPDGVIFVDNLQDNVAAAIDLGIHAHHYTDPDRLRTFLVELNLDISAKPAEPQEPPVSIRAHT